MVIDTSALIAILEYEPDAAKFAFGDCFAYALAKVLGEPLLFKGNDFNQTDIRPALL